MESSNDSFLVLKLARSKNKAPVWNHFGFNDDKALICIHCEFQISYCGNTTNLRNHLKARHRLIFNQLDVKNQGIPQSQILLPVQKFECSTNVPMIEVAGPSQCQESSSTAPSHFQQKIQTCLTENVKYNKDHPKQKEMTRQITRFIVEGMHPLRMVEEPAFLRMCQKFDPKISVPSRKMLTTNIIPTMYDNSSKKLTRILSQVSSLTVTFDMWTFRALDQYIGLTVHMIDNEWNLQSYVLENIELSPPYTAEIIKETVCTIFQKWNILEKVKHIVTDNATNVIKAIKDMERQSVPCYGHTLNLILKKGITAGMDHIIARCSKLSEFFHRSAKAKYALENKQRQLNLPLHKLIIKCETSWNSIYVMVSWILEQQLAISGVLLELGESDLMPEAEIVDLEKLIVILKPFSDLTEEFSSQSVVTVSTLLPSLEHLKSVMQPNPTDSSIIAKIKKQMYIELDNRYKEEGVANVLQKAIYLDPRLKDLPFVAKRRTKLLLKQEIIAYMNKKDDIASQSSPNGNSATTSTIQIHNKKLKTSAFTSQFLISLYGSDKQSSSSSTSKTTDILAEGELSHYSAVPPVHITTDPLEFWSENHYLFPNIAKLAKCYLSIPATSTPSERLFSVAGYIVNSKRSLLTPSNVNFLTFLSSNKSLIED